MDELCSSSMSFPNSFLKGRNSGDLGYNQGSTQTVKTRAGLAFMNPRCSLVPIVDGSLIGGSWRPRLAGYEKDKGQLGLCGCILKRGG
jgi:hypothetical protein